MAGGEHFPEMIIIAGPNGSGKTSVTEKFLRHEWAEGTLYINPDEVAKYKFGDWNSPEAVLKAANYCAALREECLQNHRSFVFETVMSGDDKVDFILRAKAAGFFIRLFFISTTHPSPKSCRAIISRLPTARRWRLLLTVFIFMTIPWMERMPNCSSA